MADLKRLAEEASAKAALHAGKDAAKRALDDLLLSDEEKEKRSAAEKASSKRRLWKYAAIAVLGVLLIGGLVGLVISLWKWFLLAGVVGLIGLYGYYRLRARWRQRGNDRAKEPEAAAEATSRVRVGDVAAGAAGKAAAKAASKPATRPEPKEEPAAAGAAAGAAAAGAAAPPRTAEEIRKRTAELRAAREREERAEAEAIDDELAAMKARLKK